jgi:hypothetical protein
MASGLPEVCQDRSRLLSVYRETAKIYAEAVGQMADLAGLGLHSEVSALRRVCRAAWEKAEQARMALYRHEADHQCDREFQRFSASAGMP